ncbi:SigE family RNA polymerase sigma factor [Streptomyces sp. SID13666]|uniref:SigE family RNA polymerase sigma factor n=1 Tax=unclassified Streptomyces TaxID=2593676 RepID=UPI0013BF2694|nr:MULTISPECIES: SigE family RNA polymerase sigma factor [unclassified Streptomyces]NEA53838.1 SigE family RNA polymerase sigma factor [Streptomyces sp. SID13666]NEA75506.1 SigE family RNA polymerase sigma factor [Streptomyces sp. SID13588]
MSIFNVKARGTAPPGVAAESVEESEGIPDFDLLAARRWPSLVRTGYLLTGDVGAGQDLAQTALASCYAHWDKVSRARDVDAYLHRVLVNAHRTRMRRRRVREVAWDRRTEASAAASVDFAPAAAWRVTVNRALAALPPRQRAVLVLRFWSDLTEAQVAAAMGCSVGTVKSQTSKALAKLRLDPALRLDPSEGQS